jgi:hypothetical protein
MKRHAANTGPGILAAIVVVLAISQAACGSVATPDRDGRTATGTVVGGIDPCEGTAPRHGPRYAAGTVRVAKLARLITGVTEVDAERAALISSKQMVGTATVAQNGLYRFRLAPGAYVLGVDSPHANLHPFVGFRVRAGAIAHIDIPNLCM